MADAVRAVERREQKAAVPEEKDTDDDDAGPREQEPRRAAGEAITESLLKAKKELEEALTQTQAEAKSLHDRWLRSAADLENYKKRAVREREEVAKFGNERLLKDFLPVVDDLDRVVQTPLGDDLRSQAVLEGVKLVSKKFLDQLEKHGVKAFSALGKTFDPNTQEAVQQVHSDEPAGKVVTELQRGFTLQDRLLRPALVVVSLGPPSQAAPDGNEKGGG